MFSRILKLRNLNISMKFVVSVLNGFKNQNANINVSFIVGKSIENSSKQTTISWFLVTDFVRICDEHVPSHFWDKFSLPFVFKSSIFNHFQTLQVASYNLNFESCNVFIFFIISTFKVISYCLLKSTNIFVQKRQILQNILNFGNKWLILFLLWSIVSTQILLFWGLFGIYYHYLILWESVILRHQLNICHFFGKNMSKKVICNKSSK